MRSHKTASQTSRKYSIWRQVLFGLFHKQNFQLFIVKQIFVRAVNTVKICSIETWKIGKSMSEKRGDFAVGYIGGKVVVAGGLGESLQHNYITVGEVRSFVHILL